MNEDAFKNAEILELKSSMKFIRNEVYVLDSVGSTNEFLMNLKTLESGTVVVAKTQTSGRGRIGRSWHSGEGGLWFSIGFNPNDFHKADKSIQIQSQRIKGINLGSALAVTKALNKFNLFDVQIKWPNDVYLHEHKICGILTQSRFDVNNNRIVVGLGLNVNQTSSDFPDDLQKKAGSLRSLTDSTYEITEILEQILVEFDKLLFEILMNGITHICDEINEHSMLNDRKIKIRHGVDIFTGQVLRIDHDGSLLVDVFDDAHESIGNSKPTEHEKHMKNFYAGEIIEF